MGKRTSKALHAAQAIGVAGAAAFCLANALVDFSLNPRAPLTMGKLMKLGEASATNNGKQALTDVFFTPEERDWFERNRISASIVAQDGTKLFGWEFPANEQNASRHRYVIVLHGYSGKPSDMARWAKRFHDEGYTVIAPALRGHERNRDTGYIRMGEEDARDLPSWVGSVISRDPDAQILLLGLSMGATTVMLASGQTLPRNVRCAIADCGFSNVWDVFTSIVKKNVHVPASPFINLMNVACKARLHLDLRAIDCLPSLRHASIPFLFVHGGADDFVPTSMAHDCFNACASPQKQLLIIPSAGHGMSASVNPSRYWACIDDFTRSHIPS